MTLLKPLKPRMQLNPIDTRMSGVATHPPTNIYVKGDADDATFKVHDSDIVQSFVSSLPT
jgi:hypothetical protein